MAASRTPGPGPRARLTARDYKSPARRGLDAGRLRELGAGAVAGLVAAGALFYYVTTHRAARLEAPPEAAARPEPRRSAPAEPDAAATASDSHYDFYERLPHFEVVVPEREKEIKRDLPAAARIERPGVYVLQAGSYHTEADANRVRAQLATLGITAKVQRVAVDTDVWYRVRIGPIAKLDELNRRRHQLQAADIDAIVIRVGD